MTKTIIFDFWGTLVEHGVWSPIKQVKTILKLNIPFSDFIVRFETAMMTRKFKELREAFLAVGEEFNIDITKNEMDQLIGTWNKSWMLAEPYEETIQVLTKLKKDHQLVLVSNTDPFSIEKVLEKHKLTQLFDIIFLSYQEGVIKTDHKFFNQLFTKHNLKKEDSVMVGDSLQSDILAAQNADIKAILIDRKDRREYKNKILSLKELEGI